MFLQLGQQVEDALGSETGLDEVAATDRFDYLPPVGILPITGEDSERGFDPETFFGDQASRDVAMTDGRLLAELVEDSLTHEPIQVGSSEKVQLYTIWENDQAVRAGLTGQRTMAFAKGTLRYRGIARFGFARWNLSRFAPHVI
jgi:hypothetical protein